MTDTCPPDCAHCSPDVDHETAHQAVLDAVRVLEAHPEADEDRIVELLQERGHSPIVAEKLNAFVPAALSWPMLKRLGVASFVGHFIAYDDNDEEVQIPVSSQHYFTAALTLAYWTVEQGFTDELPRDTYRMIADRSAEMDAVNRILTEGGTVEGARVGPLQLLRISASDMLA
ncbi:MAG: hypothetical protein ACN6QY_07105 [Pseudomonas sp.]|uniref:hypothetical protein n=1 Tax=unclassified Pseudomonas TaxID=196821 RepID=UPI001CFB22EA|nr:hypothetical protein [Pseudomonas sp. L5B5]UCZ84771.1 hypothetical protein LGQ10_00140 [Pseudomonas sp. L5B5]